MKHFTIVLVVVLFAFVGNVSGQTFIDPYDFYDDVEQTGFIETPFTGYFSRNFPTATKVHSFYYDDQIESEFYFDFKYKDDNGNTIVTVTQRDTIAKRDIVEYIKTFNKNKQLIKLQAKRHTGNIDPYIIYSYTKDGKILDIASYDNATSITPTKDTKYIYTGTNTDSIVNGFNHKPIEIIYYYTGGYDVDFMEGIMPYKKETYKFDNDNRLIEMSGYTVSANSISYKNTFEYTYYGYNRYEKYSYLKNDYKDEYHFNDKGDLISLDTYISYDSSNKVWNFSNTKRQEFTYNTITSNDKVVANLDNIITKKGAFVIDSNVANKPYYIYGLDGRLVKNGIVNSGINEIPINEGVYVISFNGTNKKMLVR